MRFVNKKTAPLLIVGLFIMGLFFPFSRISAENLPSTINEAAEKIDAISEATEKTEVQLKKETLLNIFNLTMLEDGDLGDKLAGIENLTEEQKEIREKLIDLLEENKNAYAEMEKRLSDLTTLEEIRQLAVDFKDWRTAVYNPKFEKIVSFILVFQERAILNTAYARLKKINLDIEKLENAKLLKKSDTENISKKIIDNLKLAEKLNQQAEQLITKTLIEELKTIEKSLITPTNTTSLAESATSSVKIADEHENPPSVKALVEESLGRIRTSYKLFLELAKLIKIKIGI